MHGLFVDDMMHASTSENLRDKFISGYQEDFDVKLKDVMSSFRVLGMEIEYNKWDLTIQICVTIHTEFSSR